MFGINVCKKRPRSNTGCIRGLVKVVLVSGFRHHLFSGDWARLCLYHRYCVRCNGYQYYLWISQSFDHDGYPVNYEKPAMCSSSNMQFIPTSFSSQFINCLKCSSSWVKWPKFYIFVSIGDATKTPNNYRHLVKIPCIKL